MTTVNRIRLAELVARERALYVQLHSRSAAHYSDARNLFGRVPMTWMNKWPGGFPPYLAGVRGNRITDVDGSEHIDFALGDTGAMAGHSPPETVAALRPRRQHRPSDTD